ncbi:tyrosine-protein kinase Mer isoform X2 [Topomyia yanbarensis]|nr:tyrosine-protein kinase Mer isoform X2 [Topomyia yanbarensis]
MPRDPHTLTKHECVILALCTYEVVVKPLDYIKTLSGIFQVPECVDQVCSCHYERSLPNISAEAYVSENQLTVGWSMGDYAESELPDDVELDHVLVTIRRGLNEDLVWGGSESSKKSVVLPAEPTGSYTFNVTDFPGNKTIFLVHVRLYDSRRCYVEAAPRRVFIPNDVIKNTNHTIADCTEDGGCACQYMKNLGNVSVFTRMDGRKMAVSWNVTSRPTHSVTGQELDLRFVRLIFDSRQTRNFLEKTVPWNSSGTSIDLSRLDVGGTVMLLKVAVVDSNGCEKNAAVVSVLIPDAGATQYILYAVVILCIVSGSVWMAIICQRRIKTRRVAQNWREVYVTASVDRHHPPFQMEENRLYTDMDILEARARGDADMLEVPHSCLRIGREIGKGAFGRVFMACASKLPGCNGTLIVAVKQLKKCPKADEFDEFLDEITMMKRVGRHPNIVTLLGCCTIKEPLTMIMEYIGCGDLLEYLRKIRSKHLAKVAKLEAASGAQSETFSLQRSSSNQSSNTVFGSMIKYMDIFHTSSSNSDTSYITQPDTVLRPSITETMYTTLSGSTGQEDVSKEPASIEYVLDHKELHDFARQIACGMQHLEEKQITHRDLAARNILIDERKTLKISDFGLSRTGIYVNTRNKKVPLRWLSIEAMRDNLYSSKSDVWAFGIVLWEIGTLGGYPYPTVSNHELLSFLHNGCRLDRPEICTTDLYELMLNCWKADPEDRPSFHQINKSLQPHRRIYIDFNEIEPTYVFPPTSEQIRQTVINNK